VIVCLPGIILLARAGNLWIAYVAIAIIGVGFSFLRSMMDALMQDACPRELRGTGAAVLFAAWDIAIGIESQVLGAAIDISGFDMMYGIVVVTLILSGLLAIRLSYQVSRERMTTYKHEFPSFPPA
jgi:MFS family permease